MQETADDLAALQRLLDESYEASGPHLRRIRLGARLCPVPPHPPPAARERHPPARRGAVRAGWEQLLRSGAPYARIEADRIFTYRM